MLVVQSSLGRLFRIWEYKLKVSRYDLFILNLEDTALFSFLSGTLSQICAVQKGSLSTNYLAYVKPLPD